MKRFLPLLLGLAALAVTPAQLLAGVITLTPRTITEWKAVYGQVEARDQIPARARIAGTIKALKTTEGDHVKAGQSLALVEDDKLAFQLDALDAQLASLQAQLDTAQTDLKRGQELIKRGVITKQRLDQLSTQVDVLSGQIKATEAKRRVVRQQVTEGEVLAPEGGLVLSVPLAKGSVVNPGEAVAIIGGGGMFLRLSVPERHATALVEGDTIEIGDSAHGGAQTGRLVKIYPQIIAGRVQADVEVANLEQRFVGLRILVRLPVGTHTALLVPANALSMLDGLDFITVQIDGKPMRRTVVPGQTQILNGREWREIVSGLSAGDKVVTKDE